VLGHKDNYCKKTAGIPSLVSSAGCTVSVFSLQISSIYFDITFNTNYKVLK